MIEFIQNWKNDEDGSLKRRTYRILATFFVLIGLFIGFGILFPTAAAIILNVIWVTLFAIVITFLTLGVLVIAGLKKEVGEVLDILLEGSLTLLDALEFLRKLWERFKSLLREFLVFAAPIFGYILAFIIYIAVLTFYKNFGKTYDVTGITILLTFLLVLFVGLLNSPKNENNKIKKEWIKNFAKRFHRGFTDGLEIVLFVFFITMDSTKLFFLPQELNHELKAQIGNYNLMHRGIKLTEDTQITVTMIIATISIEILRNIIKLIAMAKLSYSELLKQELDSQESLENEDMELEKPMHSNVITRNKHIRIKDSIKIAFSKTKDDLMRFITFTTVLLLAFLLFPRLKLLTLVVASITGLILDFGIKGRLTIKKNEDLISRMLSKAFGI